MRNKKNIYDKNSPAEVVRDFINFSAKFLIFFFYVSTFLAQSFVIPSNSMERTLQVGDHLLVNKAPFAHQCSSIEKTLLPETKISRFMIVAFCSPGEPKKIFVKRVIGLPGETIEIRDNRVFVNDRPIPESYAQFRDSVMETACAPGNFPAQKIPQNHYFLLGDNRNRSNDSRFWGALPRNFIIGTPWLVYWSFKPADRQLLFAGFFKRLGDLPRLLSRFFTSTRWDRFGLRVQRLNAGYEQSNLNE